jgi:hypothetical protein
MTKDVLEKLQPLHLKWDEKTRSVVIDPGDHDVFVVTVEKAILACQVEATFSAFDQQYRALLGHLAKWAHARAGKIQTAYLTTRDSGLLFLVVTESRSFDPDFESELTHLDIDVARDKAYDYIRLSVLALPNSPADAVASFISRVGTVRIEYGNGK